MSSPCIMVCQMDPARGVCIGCCRTLDEIARWGTLSGAQQEEIMQSLQDRRKKLNIPEVSMPPLA